MQQVNFSQDLEVVDEGSSFFFPFFISFLEKVFEILTYKSVPFT